MSYILNDGVSECCNASVLENTERCSDCGENCVVIIETDEEWEAECEHQQNIDLGIHDDYLDRCS